MRYSLIPLTITAALLFFGLTACGDKSAEAAATEDLERLERCVQDALNDFENDNASLLEELEEEREVAAARAEVEIIAGIEALELAHDAALGVLEANINGNIDVLVGLRAEFDDAEAIEALDTAIESLEGDLDRAAGELRKGMNGEIEDLHDRAWKVEVEYDKVLNEVIDDFVKARCTECADKGDDKDDWDKGHDEDKDGGDKDKGDDDDRSRSGGDRDDDEGQRGEHEGEWDDEDEWDREWDDHCDDLDEDPCDWGRDDDEWEEDWDKEDWDDKDDDDRDRDDDDEK